MTKWIGLYIATFVALTGVDIATTYWGISAGAQEFNAAVATAERGLAVERMVMVNLVILAFSTAMLAWALANRANVHQPYLDNPTSAIASFVHMNPFSKANRPKFIFQNLAFPIGALCMKTVASANNALIASGLPDVITPIAQMVGSFTSGHLQYWTVIFIMFTPCWLISVHLTARIIKNADRTPLRLRAA